MFDKWTVPIVTSAGFIFRVTEPLGILTTVCLRELHVTGNSAYCLFFFFLFFWDTLTHPALMTEPGCHFRVASLWWTIRLEPSLDAAVVKTWAHSSMSSWSLQVRCSDVWKEEQMPNVSFVFFSLITNSQSYCSLAVILFCLVFCHRQLCVHIVNIPMSFHKENSCKWPEVRDQKYVSGGCLV